MSDHRSSPDSVPAPSTEGQTPEHNQNHVDDKLGNGRMAEPSATTSPMTRDGSPGPEHDGLRVEKQRRRGGFLLSSSLRNSSKGRHNRGESKGKEKASLQAAESFKPASPYSRGNEPMKSSPLARVVISPKPVYDSGTHSRISTDMESSNRSEASGSHDAKGSGEFAAVGDNDMLGQLPPGGIDPTQIVNMALNLSESRRRNVSAGQLLQQQGGGARRTASAAGPSPGLMQGSYQTSGAGGSLRQYLNQQRRISRTHSPGSQQVTATSRHASAALKQYIPDSNGMVQPGIDYPYKFSASTLARAERARQYIELAVEHRRLLNYLPPLKPNTLAIGDGILTTTSVPGTSNVHLTRAPTSTGQRKHELGRHYNPLQLIRNRKLRARTRSFLNPDTEHFSNITTVREWVDDVEEASSRLSYRVQDAVRLPRYPEDGTSGPQDDMSPMSGHGRKDSTASKPKRPRSDWYCLPAEHLADAYWLEQTGNKALIENRHGNKFFASAATPEPPPRLSYESRKSHQGSVASSISTEAHNHDLDMAEDLAANKKHHIHKHHRDESRGRLKHVWHKARRRSRSSSSGLSSSDEEISTPGKRRRLRPVASSEDNIGPLERHMNRMLEEQSPDLTTPGTPNKWGTDVFKTALNRDGTMHGNRHSDSDNVAPNIDTRDYAGRAQLTGRLGNGKVNGSIVPKSRSSFEDLDSTNPNSPVLSAHVSKISLDLSPAGSRAASPARQQRKPFLPFIRHEARRSENTNPSLEDNDYQSSRNTSAEVSSAPRASLEVPPSPGRTRRLFHHKTNDSLHASSQRENSRERDIKDTKETPSAVRRFFKGGRLGEIVRNESAKISGSARKRDSPQEGTHEDELDHTDTDSMEESDTEEADAHLVRDKPTPLQRTNTGSSRRYHLNNLPSFRPAHGPKSGDDHISKQQRELLRNRSSRFDQLAPPNLDLSRVTSSTSNFADLSRTSTKASESSRDDRRGANGYTALNRNRSRLGGRLAAILDVPGSVGRGGLPATGLTEVSNQNPPTRPHGNDQRHWSISDKPRSRSPDPRVPSVDPFSIARVRALLICSGVKAIEIHRRAGDVRDKPPKFLLKAAETSKTKLVPVARRMEHVLAARMLTRHLETETSALHTDAEEFVSNTVSRLKNNLDSLRNVVESAIKTAQDMSDSCVGFGSEVSGQRTLQVRQVVEQLDKLQRVRRRRMRWVRRIGFGLVEWGVVLFMWWIWLVVMIIRLFLGVGKGVIKVIRWFLWI